MTFCTPALCIFGTQKKENMKNLILETTDNKELFFIPDDTVLEVAENEDGSSTIAFVNIIRVKSSMDEIQAEMSKSRIPKVAWLRYNQLQKVVQKT